MLKYLKILLYIIQELNGKWKMEINKCLEVDKGCKIYRMKTKQYSEENV